MSPRELVCLFFVLAGRCGLLVLLLQAAHEPPLARAVCVLVCAFAVELLTHAFVHLFNFDLRLVQQEKGSRVMIIDIGTMQAFARRLLEKIMDAARAEIAAFLRQVHLPEEAVIRIPIGGTLLQAEKEVILRTLEAHGGNRTRTAAALGMSRRTLQEWLRVNQEGGRRRWVARKGERP